MLSDLDSYTSDLTGRPSDYALLVHSIRCTSIDDLCKLAANTYTYRKAVLWQDTMALSYTRHVTKDAVEFVIDFIQGPVALHSVFLAFANELNLNITSFKVDAARNMLDLSLEEPQMHRTPVPLMCTTVGYTFNALKVTLPIRQIEYGTGVFVVLFQKLFRPTGITVLHYENYDTKCALMNLGPASADDESMIRFVTECIPAKIMKHGADSDSVLLALRKYFNKKAERDDFMTFKEAFQIFDVYVRTKPDLLNPVAKYTAACNSFELALELIASDDSDTEEYFKWVQTALNDRKFLAERWPGAILTESYIFTCPQKELLQNLDRFRACVTLGIWSQVSQFKAAIQETYEWLTSKAAFSSQFYTLPTLVLRDLICVEENRHKLKLLTSLTDDDDEYPFEPYDTYVYYSSAAAAPPQASAVNIQANMHTGTLRLADRLVLTWPYNLSVRKRIPAIGLITEMHVLGSWNATDPLDSLQFVGNDETPNLVLDETSASDITERTEWWVEGTFHKPVIRKAAITKYWSAWKHSTTYWYDGNGYLNNDSADAPAVLEEEYRNGQLTRRQKQYWRHGVPHRTDMPAVVAWELMPGNSSLTTTVVQRWRFGRAVRAYSREVDNPSPRLLYPIIQEGGSCFLAAALNLIYNSLPLRNRLIKHLKLVIESDEDVVAKLNGPFVRDDNEYLMLQGAYQVLCAAGKKSVFQTSSLTSAFLEQGCRHGGNSRDVLFYVLHVLLKLEYGVDYKIVQGMTEARSRDSLFIEARTVAETDAASGFVLLGALLSHCDASDKTLCHTVAALAFEDASENFVFDSNGKLSHYDWVTQPSTNVIHESRVFAQVDYLSVSHAFYDANKDTVRCPREHAVRSLGGKAGHSKPSGRAHGAAAFRRK